MAELTNRSTTIEPLTAVAQLQGNTNVEEVLRQLGGEVVAAKVADRIKLNLVVHLSRTSDRPISRTRLSK